MNSYKLNEIENVITFGRTAQTEEGIALFWPGSSIEFNICAHELYLEAECGYNGPELMMDIILEGERTQKFVLENGLKKYVVFKGMNPEKKVTVRIVRDTQCMPDDTGSFLLLKNIETDGELVSPPEYGHNIEFIGDSITSGEGCGLTKREEWIPVVFDAVENYTYKTAGLLNARYYVLSQSGWGVYSAWDGNLDNVMPDHYEKVCGTSKCPKCIGMGAYETWDFDTHEMDTVVINLGTNDGGALSSGKFEQEEFIRNFKEKSIAFLKNIRKRNRACFILWAYGMLGLDMEAHIKEAVLEYKKETGDERVEYLRLPVCTGDDLGVRFHPTPSGHQKAAKCIAEYIQSMQAFMLR